MAPMTSLYDNIVKISLRKEVVSTFHIVSMQCYGVKHSPLYEDRDEHVDVKAEIAQKATMFDSNHRTVEGLF